jgi:hypothetical protein
MSQRQVSPQPPPHRGARKAPPCGPSPAGTGLPSRRRDASAAIAIPALDAAARPRPRGPPIAPGTRCFQGSGPTVASADPGHATRRPTLLA